MKLMNTIQSENFFWWG